MENEPLVSICIPTYNGAAHLKACLDSCVSQTFTDYEILICDDCSSDSSLVIANSYAAVSSTVRIVKNEKNLGLVGNWNQCLQLARGQWIKFVFQDDYISADCLEKCLASADSSTQLIVSARNFILPGNVSTEKRRYYEQEVRTLENTSAYRGTHFSPQVLAKIAVKNMCMNFIAEPSLTMFRKGLLQNLGNFENDLKQICDLEFFLRIGSNFGLVYLPEKVSSFRVHQDSTTSRNISTKYFEMRYIEPLIFTWFLLYDRRYTKFRSQLNVFQFIKLNVYFRVKVYLAYRVSQKENQSHAVLSGEHHRYKEIYNLRKGNALIRLIVGIFK